MRTMILSAIVFSVITSSSTAEVIDALNTPMGRHLSQSVEAYAGIGNQGSTKLTRLTLDSNTGIFRGDVEVQVAHSWGSINVPDPTLWNPGRVKEVELAVDASGTGTFQYVERSTLRFMSVKRHT
jgi:hypothetical protein